MKPAVQEARTGCGVASVASLAGVSYSEAPKAADRLGIDAEDSRLRSDTKQIRTLLESYG